MNYKLIDNDVKVELHDETNEGYNGDYNPDDPEDKLLMRFDVFKFENKEWVEVDNSSYCTELPSDLDPEKAHRVLSLIMMEVADDVRANISIKKKCEWLSWIQC